MHSLTKRQTLEASETNFHKRLVTSYQTQQPLYEHAHPQTHQPPISRQDKTQLKLFTLASPLPQMTSPPANHKRSRNLSTSSASLPSAKLADPPSDRDRTSATDRAAESPRAVKEDTDADDMSGENKVTAESTLEREEAETLEEYQGTMPNLHEIKQEPKSAALGATTTSPEAPITAPDPRAIARKKFDEKVDELAVGLIISSRQIIGKAIAKLVQVEGEYRQSLIQAAEIAAREEGRREGYERGYAAGLEQGKKVGYEQGKNGSDEEAKSDEDAQGKKNGDKLATVDSELSSEAM